MIELALANYPGFISKVGPGGGGSFISYWPALVDSKYITENVYIDGTKTEVQPTSQLGLEPMYYQQLPVKIPDVPAGELVTIPFGRLFGTRSGDKGGCANVGVWAKTPQAYGFLHDYLTVEKFKELMADTAQFKIDRYDLPNLNALNFYIHGILGEGVSSSVRMDSQAKSMGEYIRAKHIEVPKVLAQQAGLIK